MKKETHFENNLVKELWEKPVTKIVVITGTTVLLIYLSGQIMKVLSQTILSYKGLKNAINQ